MSAYEEVIGDTLAMVNVVRQAFGKDALNELPNARPGDASDCLFFRALGDVGVTSVTGDTMNFTTDRIASVVGSLWGTQAHGQTVNVPRQFNEVIGMFDGNSLKHYETPRY